MLWKITMFIGKTDYESSCSMATFNYRRIIFYFCVNVYQRVADPVLSDTPMSSPFGLLDVHPKHSIQKSWGPQVRHVDTGKLTLCYWKCRFLWFKRDDSGIMQGYSWIYPLVNKHFAIETCHWNSWFTHETWWFSIRMLALMLLYSPIYITILPIP